ncbi:DUF5131 family protein [Mycolicibacterium fortuitum]|uniref:DUF5131 family protein n=1 Tax=Mycolicibacterium fortuitum TaxID=1766 RepID=UPI001AEF9173|nr:phage Gp37/Gp68 family protein [Mycolicibacterium fortuitum]MBP3087006.1 phage Gp37/Gp68 family protein [Mycolicibacterium fortuitum]
MSDNTGIEWCDSTWNPVTGCTKVSPGCDHCYAETIAHRFDGTKAYPNGFQVTLRPERLDQPLRWRKPRRIFVNSMSDLFHDDVPDDYIGSVFDVMARAEHHTFQILTKRHARMRSLLRKWEQEGADSVARGELHPNYGHAAWRRHDKAWCTPHKWPLPNVWLGVSTENQQWADIRIPALLDTPAAVRFISAEPLLGPVRLRDEWLLPTEDEFTRADLGGRWKWLDWVIVGGESGPGARPMHPDWARGLRDQCAAAGVPFLFKQWGEWVEDVTEHPANPAIGIEESYRVLNVPRDARDGKRCALHLSGGTALTPGNPFNPFRAGHGGWTTMRRVGKKRAGRELDGRTWDQYPGVADA